MIRHLWEAATATDRALPAGEWAGVRSSSAAERAAISAARRDVCNTFVFRGCGHALRLVVKAAQRGPSILRKLTLQQQIDALVARRRPDVPEARSSTIFAAALQLAPEAIVEMNLKALQDRCERCTCALRDDGPLNPRSQQGAFARNQFMDAITARQETR